MIASYPFAWGDEYVLSFDKDRPARLLIVPALFEEASRMRRLTVEMMRRLDLAGIDCFLPDLPGCNESLVPLDAVTPEHWRDAMATAARHFRVTHVLGIRGGALFAPERLPGWHYAPAKGASLLRQMIRARILTAREAGTSETQDGLMAEGLQSGLELAGYRLSNLFLNQFQSLVADSSTVIEQDTIGGGGLWLRAEPDEDRHQADALAAILTIGMKS